MMNSLSPTKYKYKETHIIMNLLVKQAGNLQGIGVGWLHTSPLILYIETDPFYHLLFSSHNIKFSLNKNHKL